MLPAPGARAHTLVLVLLAHDAVTVPLRIFGEAAVELQPSASRPFNGPLPEAVDAVVLALLFLIDVVASYRRGLPPMAFECA